MGTGGLGKTQLAIEYVHRFAKQYPGGVFWIDAEQGFASYIVQLSQGTGVEIDATLEEKRQLAMLWKALSHARALLIILDNFPETLTLQPWLPPAKNIHILITTRRRDLKYARVALNFMTPEVGARLINSGARQFGNEAEKLAETLGGLPLALELARNFLNFRVKLGIDELLSAIKKTGEIETLRVFAEKYQDELPSGHGKEVTATFQLSWDLATAFEKTLLQCMSLLAPTAVPRRLLRNILNLANENALEDPLGDAISTLAMQLSLVELDQEKDPLGHRLICAFVRSTLEPKNQLERKVTQALLEEMTRVYDENDTLAFRQLEKLIPHVEAVLSLDYLEPEERLDLFESLREHHRKWGRYRLAESYGKKALDFAERHFEPGHPSIAKKQSNLALVLKDLGELEEARDLAKQAYQTFLHCFGPDHPHTRISKNNWETI